MKTISKSGSNITVKGSFFVTYSASRNGKAYTTTHLNPSYIGRDITADELNKMWQENHKGLCPFNSDPNFKVIAIQQRF